MSYIKTQGMLAQEIYTSDDSNIPYPVITASGTADAQTNNELLDSTADFKAEATIVYAGDIVYNPTNGTSATVLSVSSGQVLLLNANIFPVGSENYVIYSASSVLNLQDANNGCVLYIGATGDLKVDTIGGSTVTFDSVPIGFFPVQVKKVYKTLTTAANIIAIW